VLWASEWKRLSRTITEPSCSKPCPPGTWCLLLGVCPALLCIGQCPDRYQCRLRCTSVFLYFFQGVSTQTSLHALCSASAWCFQPPLPPFSIIPSINGRQCSSIDMQTSTVLWRFPTQSVHTPRAFIALLLALCGNSFPVF
jgi:hypothetical protein